MNCGGDNPNSNFQMTQQPLILALDVYRKYELRFSDFDKFSSQIQKAVNPMRHQCNKIVHLKSKFTKYPNFETFLQIPNFTPTPKSESCDTYIEYHPQDPIGPDKKSHTYPIKPKCFNRIYIAYYFKLFIQLHRCLRHRHRLYNLTVWYNFFG